MDVSSISCGVTQRTQQNQRMPHHMSISQRIDKMESSIDQAVKDGKLTDDQATQMKSQLDDVKKQISDLKGSPIKMKINRGRNKIETFDAVIEQVYPSVFTIKTCSDKQLESQTFSYFDVLCGDVRVKEKDN